MSDTVLSLGDISMKYDMCYDLKKSLGETDKINLENMNPVSSVMELSQGTYRRTLNPTSRV